MKTILNRFSTLCMMAFLLASCNKEAELTTMAEVSFPSPVQADTETLVLEAEDADNQVITFTWPAVSYPVAAPVTYAIEFNTQASAVGPSSWEGSINIEVGQDMLSKTFRGSELNDIAFNLGLATDQATAMVVRVRAYMDRAAYSEAITITVTPYALSSSYPALWVPGDYQGWDPAAAPRILSVHTAGLFEGYVHIPAGAGNQIKFTAQPAWEPMAYGDGGDGVLIEANYAGANFSVPSHGYYYLTANLNEMTYSITPTTWSILGDATPGGWDTDTQLEYDASNEVWTVTAEMSSSGSFKFRANNAWDLDFGLDSDGKLAYANHPVYGYNEQTANITVPSSGNYTIWLSLSDPSNYHYTLIKND